jgi:hypothetical protein
MKNLLNNYNLVEYKSVLNKKAVEAAYEFFFSGQDMLERTLELTASEIATDNGYYAEILEAGIKISKSFIKELKPVIKKAKKSKKAVLTEEELEVLVNTVDYIEVLIEDALDYYNANVILSQM